MTVLERRKTHPQCYSLEREEIIYSTLDSAAPHSQPRGTHIYQLGYGVSFIEFKTIPEEEEEE